MIKKSEKITRVDASRECKENYESATLVSITSEEENQFVVNFRKDQGIDTYIWLGARKNGTWKWDDGSSYDYKNWASGEDICGTGGGGGAGRRFTVSINGLVKNFKQTEPHNFAS